MSTTDRRTAIKTRHRQAIIGAATALISEGGTARFSVDELAARADVSRRTIFNHFASIDDVVTTACTDVLGVVIEDFRAAFSASPVEPGSRSSMFDAVTAALRATDVPTVVAFLWQALGGFDANDQRPQQIFQATFSRTTDEIARELAQRHADEDSLDAELLVSSLMHGIEVIAHRWIAETGATTDVAARMRWSRLLERLIDNIRTGY